MSLQELRALRVSILKPAPHVFAKGCRAAPGLGGGALQGLALESLLSLLHQAVHRQLIFPSTSYGAQERDSNEFQMLLFFSVYNWKQKYSMAFERKVSGRGGGAFSSGVLTVI